MRRLKAQLGMGLEMGTKKSQPKPVIHLKVQSHLYNTLLMHFVGTVLRASSRVIDTYKYAKSCYISGLSWFYRRFFDGQVMAIKHIDLQNHTCKTVYDVLNLSMLPRFFIFRTLPWPIYNYGLVSNGALTTGGLYECILCHNGALMVTLFRSEDVEKWMDPIVNNILDHDRASNVILSALSERHRVQSFVAHINGVDVTTILENAVGQSLTTSELYNYMIARHGLPAQTTEDSDTVRIDIMDLESLEQTTFTNTDVFRLNSC